MKTARFTQLVEKCGAPEIHLAWLSPQRDPVLKKALTENRVMTVHQELRGGKKDYGTVGYLKGANAQILIFPKSLRRFSERRIVAIDYSLLAKDTREAGPKTPSVTVHAGPARSIKAKARNPVAAQRPNLKKLTAAAVPLQKVKKIKPKNWSVKEILVEVRRAQNELAAGKSVPAYERLKRLLAEACP